MKNSLVNKLNKNPMVLFVGLGLIILILLAVLLGLLFGGTSEKGEGYKPVIDEASGETIWDINEEPEIGDELILIGFNQINDYGYMKVQYNKIIESVREFIKKEYPNSKKASFKKGTFKYLDEQLYKASFEFVLDDEFNFRVLLDTNKTLNEISVEIEAV